jgi:putative tricarboxylic transport membrane protein
MEDKRNLRRNDLIASLILLIVGIFVLGDSIKMTFFVKIPAIEEAGWFVAPGFFPLLLGIGLVIMSSIMLSISLREGGKGAFPGWEKVRSFFKSKDEAIMVAEMALLFFYTFFLIRYLHFAIASFIYLLLAMWMVRAASWYKILIISGGVSIAVAYLFGNLFKIPLP